MPLSPNQPTERVSPSHHHPHDNEMCEGQQDGKVQYMYMYEPNLRLRVRIDLIEYS